MKDLTPQEQRLKITDGRLQYKRAMKDNEPMPDGHDEETRERKNLPPAFVPREEAEELTEEQYFKLIGGHRLQAIPLTIWDTLRIHGYKIVKKNHNTGSELQSLRQQLADKEKELEQTIDGNNRKDLHNFSLHARLQVNEKQLDELRQQLESKEKVIIRAHAGWDKSNNEIKQLKEALIELLPLAERIQSACEDGETKCYDNDYDFQDAKEYKIRIDKAKKLIE